MSRARGNPLLPRGATRRFEGLDIQACETVTARTSRFCDPLPQPDAGDVCVVCHAATVENCPESTLIHTAGIQCECRFFLHLPCQMQWLHSCATATRASERVLKCHLCRKPVRSDAFAARVRAEEPRSENKLVFRLATLKIVENYWKNCNRQQSIGLSILVPGWIAFWFWIMFAVTNIIGMIGSFVNVENPTPFQTLNLIGATGQTIMGLIVFQFFFVAGIGHSATLFYRNY